MNSENCGQIKPEAILLMLLTAPSCSYGRMEQGCDVMPASDDLSIINTDCLCHYSHYEAVATKDIDHLSVT